jgi:hypothetical protein
MEELVGDLPRTSSLAEFVKDMAGSEGCGSEEGRGQGDWGLGFSYSTGQCTPLPQHVTVVGRRTRAADFRRGVYGA